MTSRRARGVHDDETCALAQRRAGGLAERGTLFRTQHTERRKTAENLAQQHVDSTGKNGICTIVSARCGAKPMAFVDEEQAVEMVMQGPPISSAAAKSSVSSWKSRKARPKRSRAPRRYGCDRTFPRAVASSKRESCQASRAAASASSRGGNGSAHRTRSRSGPGSGCSAVPCRPGSAPVGREAGGFEALDGPQAVARARQRFPMRLTAGAERGRRARSSYNRRGRRFVERAHSFERITAPTINTTRPTTIKIGPTVTPK